MIIFSNLKAKLEVQQFYLTLQAYEFLNFVKPVRERKGE